MATLEETGRELVSVLVFWSSWTHRKVEAVALLEGDRARRRISLDLTVPRLPWPIDTPEAPQTLAPLATIHKTAMRQFDAVDHGGASLAVLSTQDNGDLSVAFLVALVEAETGHGLTAPQRASVRKLVFGAPPTSTNLAVQLIVQLSLRQTLSEHFLLRLADEFVLFACLPAQMAGTRTVVKYAYHWVASPPRDAKARLVDVARRVGAGLGLKPYEVEVALGPATAASMHLEVQAPVGLRCVDLRLIDAGGGVVASDTEGGTVAHAHASDEDVAAKGVIRFDPDLTGLHRVVTWSAWGVALLLVATRWRLPAVAIDPGTPVGLLLFGPAALLTWLVRPGENAIVSAVVGPVRAYGLALAGGLFAVGFGLSVGFDPPPYASGWGDVAAGGWGLTIAMSVLGGMVLTIGRQLMSSRTRRDGGEGD